MKIALLGYGRMGKTIEEIAIDRGHEIVARINENIEEHDLNNIDIAIDFSIPKAAFNNITTCFRNQIPVVSGTTGWLEEYNKAIEICKEENSAFIYASNFSIGVNVFFELNQKLAGMMQGLKDYSVEIEEIHHTKKLDAPSGTAITLAEQIIEKDSALRGWKLDEVESGNIPVFAKRIDDVPGTHTVKYDSEIDTIEIKHTAKSRQGFALGAVVAAEYLQDKKGIFSMKDVMADLFKN